ncbi:alpha/beta hydrolase, partial [Streptomyces sp. NPDC004579]|uniref:RBBP9/YdeN family alpha/beta hydrolase n=1 Tax=Streptomyces sp. NPDC004579 TaxID=3154667 RepID=UPI0033B8DFEA
MSAGTDPVIVIVPGLRGHVADHWQTLLADRLTEAGRTVRTVPPLTEDGLSREARVAALDKVISETEGPVVLVAHSAGVITTVHWAAQGDTARVRGALLATPPDFGTPLDADRDVDARRRLAGLGDHADPHRPVHLPGHQ